MGRSAGSIDTPSAGVAVQKNDRSVAIFDGKQLDGPSRPMFEMSRSAWKILVTDILLGKLDYDTLNVHYTADNRTIIAKNRDGVVSWSSGSYRRTCFKFDPMEWEAFLLLAKSGLLDLEEMGRDMIIAAPPAI